MAIDESKIDAYLSAEANPLKKWIEQYKKLITGQITSVDYNEVYKWEAIQHFQDNWIDNHNATNILVSLERSFNKGNNSFWKGQNFRDHLILLQFAKKDGEAVSSMFKNLYDETLNLRDRFDNFFSQCDLLLSKYLPDHEKNHYQSDRSLMLYLVLRYPSKYYLYKTQIFKTFCELTSFYEFPNTRKSETFYKVEAYMQMCESLCKILVEDEELINLHKKRLPTKITLEDNYHLLTEDFIYSVTTYLNNQEEAMNDESKNAEQNFIDSVQSHKPENVKFFFETMDQIVPELKLLIRDERIAYTCTDNQLVFLTGQRYSFYLASESKRDRFMVLTGKKLNDDSGQFIGEPEAHGTKFFDQNSVKTVVPLIVQAAQAELNRSTKSSYRNSNNIFFEKAVFDKAYRNKILNTPVVMNTTNSNLNQILYGPPGTGKTYNSITHAVAIVEELELNMGISKNPG